MHLCTQTSQTALLLCQQQCPGLSTGPPAPCFHGSGPLWGFPAACAGVQAPVPAAPHAAGGGGGVRGGGRVHQVAAHGPPGAPHARRTASAPSSFRRAPSRSTLSRCVARDLSVTACASGLSLSTGTEAGSLTAGSSSFQCSVYMLIKAPAGHHIHCLSIESSQPWESS